MLFCVMGSAFAQINYYTTPNTFKGDGYTYQCDIAQSKMATLYNKNNKFTYADQIYKSTGKEFFYDGIPVRERETWTKPKCFSIVNNAFSAAEKQRLKNRKLNITMYISPETGKVVEVDFCFLSIDSPFATIPVSVYRKIETELIKNIWFTPTAEGKKLNYMMVNWNQEIE